MFMKYSPLWKGRCPSLIIGLQ